MCGRQPIGSSYPEVVLPKFSSGVSDYLNEQQFMWKLNDI